MQIRSTFRLVAAAAFAACAMAPAMAQQVVLKVHHFLPGTSNVHKNLIQPWCDKIAKDSGGRLKCQIYPAMQLGGTPAQLFDQARDGVADIVWTIPTYNPGSFRKSEVFELPFFTRSGKGASEAFWHYVQKNALDEYDSVKLLWLHTADGSVLHMAGGKPVKTMDDMKGLKIRAATRLNFKMLAAFGATPVQMPLPGVNEAMTKGAIDGAMVPWEGLAAARLHESARSHVEAPAGQPKFANSIFAFVMNKAKYDALAPELKKVIDANSGAATSAWAGERFDNAMAPMHKLAAGKGNHLVVLSPAEISRWTKATAEIDAQWVKEVTAQGADGEALLQQARALGKQYDK